MVDLTEVRGKPEAKSILTGGMQLTINFRYSCSSPPIRARPPAAPRRGPFIRHSQGHLAHGGRLPRVRDHRRAKPEKACFFLVLLPAVAGEKPREIPAGRENFTSDRVPARP